MIGNITNHRIKMQLLLPWYSLLVPTPMSETSPNKIDDKELILIKEERRRS